MIQAILTWWGRQLLSLIPGRLRAEDRNAVTARLRGDAIDVSVRRGGRLGTLGTFPLTEAGVLALAAALGPRRAPLNLQLPSGRLLERTVVLPLAAERDPGSVLRFEMDRLTPFTADMLHWTWTMERRDRVRGQLHIKLSMVLRRHVEGTLGSLRRAGLRLSALSSERGVTIPLDVETSGIWLRRSGVLLGTLVVLLAITAAAIPFIRQAQVGEQLDQRIAALRPVVERAEALRRGMSQAAAGVNVAAAQRARFGDPLATLAALTEILPDDTVLTDLTIRERVITMAGQSAAAARLIPALAADPAIRNPAFTAPVTRNDTQRTDIFSIRAEAAAP